MRGWAISMPVNACKYMYQNACKDYRVFCCIVQGFQFLATNILKWMPHRTHIDQIDDTNI